MCFKMLCVYITEATGSNEAARGGGATTETTGGGSPQTAAGGLEETAAGTAGQHAGTHTCHPNSLLNGRLANAL